MKMNGPLPQDAPWAYYTQRQAARRLGVEVNWLKGLVNNPIPAVPAYGRSGGVIWLFQKEAIDQLVAKIVRAS